MESGQVMETPKRLCWMEGWYQAAGCLGTGRRTLWDCVSGMEAPDWHLAKDSCTRAVCETEGCAPLAGLGHGGRLCHMLVSSVVGTPVAGVNGRMMVLSCQICLQEGDPTHLNKITFDMAKSSSVDL